MKILIFNSVLVLLISLDFVQSVIEPALLRRGHENDIKQYSEGQIVKIVNGHHYRVRDHPESNARTLAILSPEEYEIYERIKSRLPASSEEYRIPRVTYKDWDKLMRQDEDKVWHEIGIVIDGVMLKKIPFTHGIREPLPLEQDDVLIRETEFPSARPKWRFVPIAAYWKRMWLVPGLLPEDQAEELRKIKL